MKRTTIFIDEAKDEKLREISYNRRISKALIIRRAIDEYLEREEKAA